MRAGSASTIARPGREGPSAGRGAGSPFASGETPRRESCSRTIRRRGSRSRSGFAPTKVRASSAAHARRVPRPALLSGPEGVRGSSGSSCRGPSFRSDSGCRTAGSSASSRCCRRTRRSDLLTEALTQLAPGQVQNANTHGREWLPPLLFCLVFARLVFHAILVPVWEGPDEPFHLARIASYADQPFWEAVLAAGDLPDPIAASIRAHPCGPDLQRAF